MGKHITLRITYAHSAVCNAVLIITTTIVYYSIIYTTGVSRHLTHHAHLTRSTRRSAHAGKVSRQLQAGSHSDIASHLVGFYDALSAAHIVVPIQIA